MSDDSKKPTHQEQHKEMHEHLDLLVAHWITTTGKRPSQATVLEFMQWSGQQACQPNHEHPN